MGAEDRISAIPVVKTPPRGNQNSPNWYTENYDSSKPFRVPKLDFKIAVNFVFYHVKIKAEIMKIYFDHLFMHITNMILVNQFDKKKFDEKIEQKFVQNL